MIITALARWRADEFNAKNAQPHEEARYHVSEETARLNFERLVGIHTVAPQLILNLEETGVGASKSGHGTSRKVNAPMEVSATTVF
jgi:hypothetical protein